MDYISTQEVADKRGVSLRQVQRLLHHDRITGARKYGVSWMIPADAEKPDDPRKASEPAGRVGDNEPLHTDDAEGLFPLLHLRGGDIAGAYASCKSNAECTLLDVSFVRWYRTIIIRTICEIYDARTTTLRVVLLLHTR